MATKPTNHLTSYLVSSIEPLTIFVGAGISADQGIPTWADLVEALLVGCLPDVDSGDSKQDVAKALVQAYFQLPSASIVDELLGERFGEGAQSERDQRIKEMLYPDGGSEPKQPSMAQYVLRVATAAAVAQRDVHIVTTNYDDLLEEQAKVGSSASLLETAGLEVHPFAGGHCPHPANRKQIPIVHIHGFAPRGSGANGSPLVFAEGDYSSWMSKVNGLGGGEYQNYLAADRFARGQVLFIGTTLRDYNIIALLRRTRSDSRRIALMPVYGDEMMKYFEPESPVHRYLGLRGRHVNVDILRPHLYSQVYQFLQEVASAIMPGATVPAPYGHRLSSWWSAWGTQDHFVTETRLSAGRKLVSQRNEVAAMLPYVAHAKAEIWVRHEPDRRVLQRWASSQAALLFEDGARPHEAYILSTGKYAAVDAFAQRSPLVGEFVPEAPSRWSHFVAAPVVLDGKPYSGLPVGVCCIMLAAQPNQAAALSEILEQKLPALAEKMVSLGVKLLRPAGVPLP